MTQEQNLQSGTKPLEKLCKTRIFNLYVRKQRAETVGPPPPPPLPHTMLLMAGTFNSTLNGGGGALKVFTNNRFARSSPVFNNVLNTFVPDCRNLRGKRSWVLE